MLNTFRLERSDEKEGQMVERKMRWSQKQGGLTGKSYLEDTRIQVITVVRKDVQEHRYTPSTNDNEK